MRVVLGFAQARTFTCSAVQVSSVWREQRLDSQKTPPCASRGQVEKMPSVSEATEAAIVSERRRTIRFLSRCGICGTRRRTACFVRRLKLCRTQLTVRKETPPHKKTLLYASRGR